MDNTESILRSALESHGAREFEMVALMMDPHRGLAALNYAVAKGAERPIPYAIAVFDNEEWKPQGETRRVATNQAVEKTCSHCGRDRFVVVTHDPSALYGETYAPCSACNPKADTTRWVSNERRVTAAR